MAWLRKRQQDIVRMRPAALKPHGTRVAIAVTELSRTSIPELPMPHDDLLGRPHSERGLRLHEQVRLAEEADSSLGAPPLQVLVVDDDSELRDLITLALLDEGYQVVSASNGAEALERVQLYCPDVILLDLHMPVMDGPTFAERYHALPGKHAPIVVFTAGGNAHRSAQRIRAAAYVDKPGDLWSLAALLRACADPLPNYEYGGG
jgi:CheY-like chemotaxis protein